MSSLRVVALILLAATTERASDPCAEATEALRRKDNVRAEVLLRQCVAAHPDRLLPYIQLCALYQSLGREDDLVQTARAGMKQFPEEKRFYITTGNRAGRDRHFEEAARIFGEAHRRWPGDQTIRERLAGSHLGLGMKLLDEKKYAEAEKQLRRAVELSPDDVEARMNLGRALHNLVRSSEAISQFDRALELDPRLPLLHFHRGVVLYQVGEFSRAIGDLTREIELNPGYPPSYLFRGLARYANSELDAALKDLDIAVAQMPEILRAHYARARCLERLGKTSEAETEYRQAMQLDPEDPVPVSALARLMMELGRKEEALDLSNKAKQLMAARRSKTDQEVLAEPALTPREP